MCGAAGRILLTCAAITAKAEARIRFSTCLAAYTSEVTSLRQALMSEDAEREIEQPKTQERAPEGVKRASQFADTNKQVAWTAATENYRTSDKDSVTMPAITEEMNEILKAHVGKWNKCEIDYASDFAAQQPEVKLAVRDDYLNRTEYSQPESIPVGKHVFVEDLLRMASPIGPASQQSETLKGLMGEMRKHPWKVEVVFEPHPENPEYDPNENQGVIYVDSTHSKQKQIETFAHELYHATHQNLDDLYGGKEPVSLERYKQIRAIDENLSKEQIANFLREHPAAAFGKDGNPVKDSSGHYETESYSEKHEDDYSKHYKPNFNENRRNLLQRDWLGKGYERRENSLGKPSLFTCPSKQPQRYSS